MVPRPDEIKLAREMYKYIKQVTEVQQSSCFELKSSVLFLEDAVNVMKTSKSSQVSLMAHPSS